jgi:hypothetical protein
LQFFSDDPYNLHHGHEHIKDFKGALALMKPYLLCLNLNGMTSGGPKIVQLGAGEHDVALLKTIAASGYRGPISIIGHTNDELRCACAIISMASTGYSRNWMEKPPGLGPSIAPVESIPQSSR